MAFYEFVYLNSTGERVIEHDIEKVRSVPGGYLIRVTPQTAQFVPMQRVVSEAMPLNMAVLQWGAGSAWLKSAGEAEKEND